MKKIRNSKFEIRNQSAFTLVETIIVVFLFAILIVVLFNLYEWHGKIYNFQTGLINVTGSARNSMNELQSYVLQAHRVLASQSVGGTTYLSDADTLVLQLPSIDASNNIVADTWDYAVFYLDGAKLYETVEANAASVRPNRTKLLSGFVDSLAFTYDNADFTLVKKVDIDLQTKEQVREQLVKNRLMQTLYLRNY